MLDAEIIWRVVDQPALLAVLGVTVVLAWPLGRLLNRGVLGVAFVVLTGAVLAATTTTELPHHSVGGVGSYLHGFGQPTGLLRGFAGSREKLANIGLFFPSSMLAMLVWRRAVTIAGAGAAVSFAIEGWQGFIGRGGDPVDVVHNAAGALLGAGVGYVLLLLAGKRARQLEMTDGPGRATYSGIREVSGRKGA